MPHKQEIFADLKRRCERGDQVQVSASVSCQQWWWWMDRGSKPCRTLESTTWGYFEDSGRAVSAEQIPLHRIGKWHNWVSVTRTTFITLDILSFL